MVRIYKIDLHTHSVDSPDGGLSLEDYSTMLDSGQLDYIAITDHDSIEFALVAKQRLGEAIIIGEEISTQEGDIIGLFLKQPIQSGLSASQAVRQIHRQGGLVYIPHPFETVRKGLNPQTLESISGAVDIIEIFNGRALIQNKSNDAKLWAKQRTLPGAASSDAHGVSGWGKTATLINDRPTAKNLTSLLGHAQFIEQNNGLRATLFPKINRLKKRWGYK